MEAKEPGRIDEEELLARFFEEYPEGTRSTFDEWIRASSLYEAEPATIEEAQRLLAAWAPAARALQQQLGESLFRFGSGVEKGATTEFTGEVSGGDRLGNYVLVRFLGKGGMGQVWEAEDLLLRRRVAVKLLRSDRIDPRSMDLFVREARAGGRAVHPNLVATLGYESDGERSWIVQELVEGSWTIKDSLDRIRGEERVPKGYYRRVARIVGEIAAGMQAAHDSGVIHRDLKPHNILLDPADQPKVTDFGLARLSDDSFLSLSGEVAGTWAYMSPEQVEGRTREIDHRTDVFSLGGILYELLTLRRAFEGDSSQQVARRIVGEDPPLANSARHSCPRDLALIAGKALEKSPGRRYQTMEELRQDLQRFLEHRPVIARQPGVIQRGLKYARRHPALASAGAIGVVAFVLVSALSIQLLRQSDDLRDQTELARGSADLAAKQAKVNADLAREADARTQEVLALSVSQRVRALRRRAALLWPAYPERIPDYELWLKEAKLLLTGDGPAASDAIPDVPSIDYWEARLDEIHEGSRSIESPAIEVVLEPQLLKDLDRTRARRDWLRAMLGRGPFPGQELEHKARNARRALVYALDHLRPRGFDPMLLGAARANARRAMDEIDVEGQGLALVAMGWAELRHGVLDDARSYLDLATAAAVENKALRLDLSWLREGLESWVSQDLEDYERELERLERRCVALEIRTGSRTLAEGSGFWHKSGQEGVEHWWHRQISELVDGIEALHDARFGLAGMARSGSFYWGVERRLALACEIERRSTDPDLALLWEDTLNDIERSSLYRDLRMERLPGFEPLGPDPESGFHEFAHLASGEVPKRGPDGSLGMVEESGIVLVLLPGGRFWMGAQKENPAGTNYDVRAKPQDGPVHEVELSPFLLSKYELTQAQWLRLTGEEPSEGRLGVSLFGAGRVHPVEVVSWNSALDCLRTFDLDLPSEARWEYAMRSGTTSPWPWGADPYPEEPLVNLADRSALDFGVPPGLWPPLASVKDYRDGFVVHAPVGSLPANAFGIHDMAGNVREFVLDGFRDTYYAESPRLDPVCTSDLTSPQNRMLRGSAASAGPAFARSADRGSINRDDKRAYAGIRAARSITVR